MAHVLEMRSTMAVALFLVAPVMSGVRGKSDRLASFTKASGFNFNFSDSNGSGDDWIQLQNIFVDSKYF